MSDKRASSADLGLLIIRLGLGLMFMLHGWPKITGGPEKWSGLGMVMQHFGITFAPVFWGFMAAVSEFVGGLFLAAGIFMRPACALLVITMAVAATMHLKQGDGLNIASHAIEAGLTFLGLLLIGPGRHRLRVPGDR